MILTVWERLIVGMCLPVQGDFTTLRIIRKTKEDLSFSEDEHKILKFKSNPEKNSTTWDLVGAQTTMKDFSFGEKAMEVIKDSLEKAFKVLDEKKELTMEHLNLYEKFCESK